MTNKQTLDFGNILGFKNRLEKIKLENSLLVIGGVTASGKTYLAELLAGSFPEYFEKLTQVTTREKRIGEGEGYDFINDIIYDKLVAENRLFAKTEFYGKKYGTYIPEDISTKCRMVVVNEEGLKDSLTLKDRMNIIRVGTYVPPEIIVERLSKGITTDIATIERSKRDISSEFGVYKECDDIINNFENTNYELVRDLVEILEKRCGVEEDACF